MSRLHPARNATVLIAITIAILSVVPAKIRPVTTSHSFEHIIIYSALGLSAGLSYLPRPAIRISGSLALFCLAIEILQIGIPGRQARIEDLALDLIGSQLDLHSQLFLFQFSRICSDKVQGTSAAEWKKWQSS